jgi:L-lactate utilization protein LutC
VEAIVREHAMLPDVLVESGALMEALGLRIALRARGINLIPVAEAGTDLGAIEIGLTCAELAIAQSGTLLVGGQVGGWGIASALPRVHIALVRESDIESNLAAAFPRFHEAFIAGQQNWVWVSGPSKTADIAMQLVTGVHGPNILEVLVVADGAGSAP